MIFGCICTTTTILINNEIYHNNDLQLRGMENLSGPVDMTEKRKEYEVERGGRRGRAKGERRGEKAIGYENYLL